MDEPLELLVRAIEAAGIDRTLSRRGFLRLSACAVAGFASLGAMSALGQEGPLVILDNASGLIVGDPTRCVGCGRCELACTEFNDGKAQPSVARIKVSRNLDFGPEGPVGGPATRGAWGSGLVVQDVCRQCPHPVPCATACSSDAIVMAPVTGARVVDPAKCVGCRLCQRACPWGMISFDEDRSQATKCFLCDGAPKCVEACPAEALRYVAWQDLTRTAPRAATLVTIPPDKAAACRDCHK
jgi:Fe-S-cluster-containing dehydrogenase component